LNLFKPLHTCFQAFVATYQLWDNFDKIPNTVMEMTGVDIRREAIKLLRDVYL
jgi:hypothetical protein